MSGGLAPSKSTVYVSNLPFQLTNNDLHQLFEKYGRVVKVTVLKDKKTRASRGVAFVLYLDREGAHKCVGALHGYQLLGRTLKCSLAKDNGRAAEFIKRRSYTDKSHCFECGEEGHLSYDCPKNLLGNRDKPAKKRKIRKQRHPSNEEEEEEDAVESDEETLTAAIRHQRQLVEEEQLRSRTGYHMSGQETSSGGRKKIIKRSSYFSDEEEVEDDPH